MAIYVSYSLPDGSSLLVETDVSTEQPIKAANKQDGNIIIDAKEKFTSALGSVKSSLALLAQDFAALEAEELEVSFGIKTVGEVGFFAVCKAGGEVNYTVTLKWKKPDKPVSNRP